MMSYFGLRDWNVYNGNVSGLAKILRQSDGGRSYALQFDMTTIDWNEYFLSYLPGIKKYFFKENYSNLVHTQRHYAR